MKKHLIDLYLKYDIFKISFTPPFTWSSGIQSPFYCDHRKILAYPDLRSSCIDALISLIKDEFVDVKQIAGVATAGIPWGAIMADRLNLPFCYVRNKPKDHGLGKMIEGSFNTDLPTIIIEDLFSTGKSVLLAHDSIRKEYHQANILGFAALFSYNLSSAFSNAPTLKSKAKSVLSVNDILKYKNIDESKMEPYRKIFA